MINRSLREYDAMTNKIIAASIIAGIAALLAVPVGIAYAGASTCNVNGDVIIPYFNGVAHVIDGTSEDDFIDCFNSAWPLLIINGGKGNDIIHGSTYDDIIRGGIGDDFLHGEDGSDYIQGGRGDDYMNCGDGNSHVDTLEGGLGYDIADTCDTADSINLGKQ
jgi:Ca2+-binding RTX toxin-like protein